MLNSESCYKFCSNFVEIIAANVVQKGKIKMLTTLQEGK